MPKSIAFGKLGWEGGEELWEKRWWRGVRWDKDLEEVTLG